MPLVPAQDAVCQGDTLTWGLRFAPPDTCPGAQQTVTSVRVGLVRDTPHM